MLDPCWSWPFIAERHPGILKANISPKSSQRCRRTLKSDSFVTFSKKMMIANYFFFFRRKKFFSRRRIKKLEDDEFLISLETFSRTGLGSNLFWGERLPSLALSRTQAHTRTRTLTHSLSFSHMHSSSLSLHLIFHTFTPPIHLSLHNLRESVCEQYFV